MPAGRGPKKRTKMEDAIAGAFLKDPVLVREVAAAIGSKLRERDESQRASEARVRARIFYAVKSNHRLVAVIVDGENAIGRAAFCAWAVEKFGPSVREIPGFPSDVTVRLIGEPMAVGSGLLGPLRGSDDPEWLKANYPVAEAELQRLRAENESLRDERAAKEARKRDRQERGSRYGKKGGRGRTL